MRSRTSQRGQTSAEYLGVLVLVAGLIAGITASGVPARLATSVAQAVCRAGLFDCGRPQDTRASTGSRETGAPQSTLPDTDSGAPVFGTEAVDWDGDAINEHGLPAPDASPAEIRVFFDSLTAAERDAVADKYPDLVGRLDGAPAEMRYRANRILILRELERLERLRAQGVGGLDARIATLQGMADPSRQLLMFDPSGDGRAAEAFGDFDAAEHVAVLVPGAGNTLDNFDGFNDSAELVQGTIAELWPDRPTATIAWLGYDTPDFLPGIPFPGPGATLGDSAAGAADTLPPFLQGIDRPGLHVTVIGHSYGSVAVGLSARRAMVADDVVFIGSPGVRADSAADLGFYNVWAGLNPDDPIRFVDNVSVLGIGHGRQPARPPFGARRFRTDGASGHAYYIRDSEALYNMARIIIGTHDDATLCHGDGDDCE